MTTHTHEIDKFTSIASKWWDQTGPFKPLHQINPTRLDYITRMIKKYHNTSSIEGLEILDIGCGGGIVSIPLSRIGAKVTGIDLGRENIDVAKAKADQENLKINFLHIELGKLKPKKPFDVILCLEVLEHVDDLKEFMTELCRLVSKNTLVICSTFNRTLKSKILGIWAAEYMLGIIPKGTHQHNKFITPSELSTLAKPLILKDLSGMEYDVFSRKWKITKNIYVNYFACFAL